MRRRRNTAGALLCGCLLVVSGGIRQARSWQPAESPGAILKPLLRETPKPRYAVDVPAQVRGNVRIGREAAAGVSVTDRYSVVKTDAEGSCRLTPHADSMFV